jgi:branched-chain amino acid transport system permease protein
VAETIWSGLTLGSIYILVSLGFMLSLLPSGVINFAQGAIVAAGTYLTYQWFHANLPLVVAIVLNLACGVALGVFCELVAIRPLRWRRSGSGQSTELVTTVGISTALIGLMSLIWGVNALPVPFHGPTGAVRFFGVVTEPVAVILLVTAVLLGVVLHVAFRKTRWGQACLALAEDRAAASLRGINVNVLSLVAFGAAGALGTVCGILIGPVAYATPTGGTVLALGGFVALAMGGNGSFLGCVPGGLLVGLAAAFATRYLGASYSDLAVLVLLLVTLSIKPRGIGGAAGLRSV